MKAVKQQLEEYISSLSIEKQNELIEKLNVDDTDDVVTELSMCDDDELSDILPNFMLACPYCGSHSLTNWSLTENGDIVFKCDNCGEEFIK